MPRRYRWLSLVLILTLMAAACTASPTPSPDVTATPKPTGVPRFEPVGCWFKEPAGEDVQCGWLIVPEDHARPDGPTIKLAVARFKSDSANPAPEPIVYLEGGPGGSPLRGLIGQFGALFGPLLKNNDVILIDQRGTGYSQPALDCPEYDQLVLDTLDQNLTIAQSEQLSNETMLKCRARLIADGANLAVYNSAQSAADLEALRQALQLDKINLYGISYGTRLALTMMRDFPQGIRSVVIDSVLPPQEDLYASTITNGANALNKLFDACAADATCNAAYPNLRQTFLDLKARLDKQPVTFPVTVPDGSKRDLLLNGDGMVSLIFQGMYATSLLPSVPRMITDIRDGNYELAAGLEAALLDQSKDISNGMHYSVNCEEEVPFSNQAALDAAVKQNPDFAVLGGDGTYALCKAWDEQPANPIENEPVTSSIPTLIFSGGFDPITPVAWGQAAAKTLSHSFFFELPAAGHGASLSEDCPRNMLIAFFKDPNVRPDDSCISTTLGKIAFAAPLRAEDITLTDFTEPLLGLTGKVPAGWKSVGPGTYTPSGKQTDTIALLMQAGPIKADTFLNLIKQQFEQAGVKVDLRTTGTRQANGLDWTLYATEASVLGVDIAVAEKGGQTYFVVMQSPLNDRGVLYNAVFLPAVDALKSTGK